MTVESGSIPGVVLMFALGLRHGLDPDHIACIDGLTWRRLALPGGQRNAAWIGTLFAAGHGLLVTGIAVSVSSIAPYFDIPTALVPLLSWVPTALLLLVGSVNLRLLLSRHSEFKPVGWKLGLIPKRLREHSSPWAVVLIGILFASVFDTATQASAWGFAAKAGGGAWTALLIGLAFTVGMVITDSVDGRLICRISASADGAARARGFRRCIGWLIVGISFGVAAYNVLKAFIPKVEIDEVAFSLTGLCLVAVMLVLWLVIGRSSVRGS